MRMKKFEMVCCKSSQMMLFKGQHNLQLTFTAYFPKNGV